MAAKRPTRGANQECRAPIVVTDLDEVELDGLEDHDGWSESAITGYAVAADAEHVNISRSTISSTRFTGANLRKLELTDVKVANSDFAGAVLEELALNRVSFTNCRFSGADLGGASLVDVRFTDCQLDEVALRLARAERLHVEGGTATKVDLYRAEVRGSRWHDTDLTGADLSGANLDRARLQGSVIVDVRGAKALQGCVIDHEQVVTVGLALMADSNITIDEDR
ncbi:MAG: pentapeptide repeat-containing protein [Aquihabitans sp.]